MSWKDDFFIYFLKVHKSYFEKTNFYLQFIFSFLSEQNYGRFGIIFPTTII